ncbi:uncharacterized protein LOC134243786 [Saccostrea cucullata]|uniref:uncharacterized protein LOC134243786 n=1 Tax=Saccostrea cuccullata TaxID=36930 RepID=UPI002ED5C115
MSTRQDPDGRSRFAKLGLAINDELTQAYRDILEMEVTPASDCEKEKVLLDQVSSLKSDVQEIKVALWSGRKDGLLFRHQALTYFKAVVSSDPRVRPDDAEDTNLEGASVEAEELLNLKDKELELFEKELSKCKVPKNLVIFGQQGVGKSSFINSVIASFSSNCWREWTKVGDFDGCRYGERVTRQLIQISKDEYLDSERQKKFPYPTLINLNGFQYIFLEKLIVLLRYVLFGLVTEKHKLLDALKFYGYEDIKQAMAYLSKPERTRADGLIFMTSAVSSLPHNILNAVRQVAVLEAGVPLFGVLTELDKVNDWEALAIKKKEFCSKLGFSETRLLLCTNYCDDYDTCSGHSRLNQVHPELDVPILSFMRQVCDIVNIDTKLKAFPSSGKVIRCSALGGKFSYNSAPVVNDMTLVMGLVVAVIAFGYWTLTK